MIGKVEDIITYLFKLDRDKEYQVEIKEYKQKRSLNANAYAWVLINKIANVMRLSKEEVYLNMLKHYGQSQVVSIVSEVNITGYFKYYEVIGTSTLNNKEFNHIRVFKGSSEYDTKEMSIFIDGIVQEAKQLDIETLTPNQLAELKALWS